MRLTINNGIHYSVFLYRLSETTVSVLLEQGYILARINMILCKNADTDVVEYSLSRSLPQTMIDEYKTKLIDKSILRRKLAELYDMAEEEVKNSQQD